MNKSSDGTDRRHRRQQLLENHKLLKEKLSGRRGVTQKIASDIQTIEGRIEQRQQRMETLKKLLSDEKNRYEVAGRMLLNIPPEVPQTSVQMDVTDAGDRRQDEEEKDETDKEQEQDRLLIEENSKLEEMLSAEEENLKKLAVKLHSAQGRMRPLVHQIDSLEQQLFAQKKRNEIAGQKLLQKIPDHVQEPVKSEPMTGPKLPSGWSRRLPSVGFLNGLVVYGPALDITPSCSAAAAPPASVPKKSVSKKPKDESRPHIKKPLNAFMLYSKEQRQTIKAELNTNDNKIITTVLGQRWQAMSNTEQEGYFAEAARVRRLHAVEHPDWVPSSSNSKKATE